MMPRKTAPAAMDLPSSNSRKSAPTPSNSTTPLPPALSAIQQQVKTYCSRLRLWASWVLLPFFSTLFSLVVRRRLLDTLAKDLGNPIAIKLTRNEYAEYRTNALKAGANPKTLNNRLDYLHSVFNVLFQLSDIDYPNPPARARPLQLQESVLKFNKRGC
jgi:hypothetical protein